MAVAAIPESSDRLLIPAIDVEQQLQGPKNGCPKDSRTVFLPRRILTPRYPSVLPRARRSKCRTFRNGMEVRSPDETHDRDPLCPLDVDSRRRPMSQMRK